MADSPAKKTRKPRATFMLHSPVDMSSLGKYVSTDYRYAALKVASRGHKRILLRRTNTKEIREFEGDVVTLTEPKRIHRGDRVIEYHKRPTVKFIKNWVYNGPIDDDTPVPAKKKSKKTAAAAAAADTGAATEVVA